ncbi:Fic family protein [Marinoscillum sp.]|uniref:Fic family protein n=1 Tax=Marinoscillum sp. TaxID=2024838 RepID=UPI003BABC6BD
MWNWQHRNWPQFIYNEEDFIEYERQFFEKAGIMQGSIQHIDEAGQETLKIDLMSDEALKTSEIEGEFLNRDSLQSSIRRQFGLQTDHRKIPPAEQGIAEMMVDLYKNYHAPLDEKNLYYWHKTLTNGRHDLLDIGRFRTHEDPMQVVSGPIGRPVIHFEAPPSGQVPNEMSRFIHWFNETGKDGRKKLPALVHAAVTHLYFECIHPFEDGNGRIGRAISEKSLSQSLGRPVLLALSHTIEENKKSYYEALERNNKDLEISGWISYFCETVLKAQDHTQEVIKFIIEKGKFYRRFEDRFNERQQKVVERMFNEGVNGFKGGLSAKNYASITGAPSATTTRDLSKMVEIGAFKKTGELKSTRYFLNIDY